MPVCLKPVDQWEFWTDPLIPRSLAQYAEGLIAMIWSRDSQSSRNKVVPLSMMTPALPCNIVGAADMSGLGRQYHAAYPTRLSQQAHTAPSHLPTQKKKREKRRQRERNCT